jgi:predicted deacetylase
VLCKPAQYLLRIDDLCPTVFAERWRELAILVTEFQLRPILAVVPENRDPELEKSPANPAFWSTIRQMQAAGATLALHGYRHLCASRGRSLLRLARNSEFAGVDACTQRAWIREGLRILRSHGLNPQVWVAPRHGFDPCTLQALNAEGIKILSDGLARIPFVRQGLTWIPQQLWAPRHQGRGVWSICIHPNTVRLEQLEALRRFVHAHRIQFTSVDRVLSEFPPQPLSALEDVYATLAFAQIRTRHWCKRAAGLLGPSP